jgi:hypothetical protein
MDSRELSIGEIVDYMPGFRDPNVLAVCVWFKNAKVQPITMSEAQLRAREISIRTGNRVMAIIDTEALDEFSVNPTNISPIE